MRYNLLQRQNYGKSGLKIHFPFFLCCQGEFQCDRHDFNDIVRKTLCNRISFFYDKGCSRKLTFLNGDEIDCMVENASWRQHMNSICIGRYVDNPSQLFHQSGIVYVLFKVKIDKPIF